ncbi:MAG: signal recognition particle receptor subunit alpha, partial [Proteobacteria bacterium]|nr:signal recognition particle receptor subunit alpha [Pseudomonadota bacterium]
MFGFSKKENSPDKTEKTRFFAKLKGALHKSSAPLAESLSGVFTKKPLDDETLVRLEEILIKADLGPELAARFCEQLRRERFGKDISEPEIRAALAEKIAEVFAPFAKALDLSGPRPFVILMVGVNGAGKTTTLAKFAKWLKDQGKSALLVAGDTFRAAAVEQLKIWGARAGVPVLAGEPNSDPASLAFKGVQQASAQNLDVVLIDTAGRL